MRSRTAATCWPRSTRASRTPSRESSPSRCSTPSSSARASWRARVQPGARTANEPPSRCRRVHDARSRGVTVIAMSIARAATDILIARQPIYDTALRVVAYELLVQRRDGSDAGAEGDAAGTISEIGLNLVSGHRAHIPLSRGLLLEGYVKALPADRVALQVSPSLALDRAARETIEELVAAGYPLALVDFEPGGPSESLLPFAHVVGLRVDAAGRTELRTQLGGLRQYGASLLAL